MSDETTRVTTPTSPTPTPEKAPVRSFRDVASEEYQTHRAFHKPIEPAVEEPKAPVDDEDEDFEDEDTDDSADESSDDGDGKGDGKEAESDSDSDDDDDEEDEGDDETEEAEDDDKPFLKVKVGGKTRSFTKEQVSSMIASGAHRQETYAVKEKELLTHAGQVKKKGTEIETAAKKLAPVWDALGKKDIEAGFLEFASVAGLSKLEVRRSLRDQMMNVLISRLGLQPEWVQNRMKEIKPQLDVLDTKEENEFLEEQLKNQRTQAAPVNDELSAAKQEIQKFQFEKGVSRDEMRAARDFVLKEICGGDRNKLTLQMVFSSVENGRLVKKAFNAIRSRKPSLAKDSKFVDRVISKARKHPEWEVADLARYVGVQSRKMAEGKQADSGKQLATDLSRKVLSSKPRASFQSPSEGKKRLSFRDLPEGILP